MEYSIKKKKAYCLYCYLFGDMVGKQGRRYAFVILRHGRATRWNDAFVTEGFNTWSKKNITETFG